MNGSKNWTNVCDHTWTNQCLPGWDFSTSERYRPREGLSAAGPPTGAPLHGGIGERRGGWGHGFVVTLSVFFYLSLDSVK
jgi:hypothetical protein